MLRRAPKLLRVVVSPHGKLDALDQLEDEPRPREKVFVYERVGEPSWVHIKMSPRSSSGYYAQVTYRFIDEQPSDGAIRDTRSWRGWAKHFSEVSRAER